jgi:hypothetical protein
VLVERRQHFGLAILRSKDDSRVEELYESSLGIDQVGAAGGRTATESGVDACKTVSVWGMCDMTVTSLTVHDSAAIKMLLQKVHTGCDSSSCVFVVCDVDFGAIAGRSSQHCTHFDASLPSRTYYATLATSAMTNSSPLISTEGAG